METSLFLFSSCQLTSYATKPYSKRVQIISVVIFLALFDKLSQTSHVITINSWRQNRKRVVKIDSIGRSSDTIISISKKCGSGESRQRFDWWLLSSQSGAKRWVDRRGAAGVAAAAAATAACVEWTHVVTQPSLTYVRYLYPPLMITQELDRNYRRLRVMDPVGIT